MCGHAGTGEVQMRCREVPEIRSASEDSDPTALFGHEATTSLIDVAKPRSWPVGDRLAESPAEVRVRHGGERDDWLQLPAVSGGKSPWMRRARRGLPVSEPILIVDDCTLFRENLAAALALNGFPPPHVAWDLRSLVTVLQRSDSRIALVNVGTRSVHLLLKAAMDIRPDLRVIALGASTADESGIVACAEAGVAGYHLRADSLEDLIALINGVAAGASSCPPWVSEILLRRLSALAVKPQHAERELALTTRESQILRMLEMGSSNRDIAAQLSIAVHTVKNHVHSVLTKLGVTTRAEAAAISRTLRTDRGGVRRN
jgi:DNA-binding NarL/FixJ family response regulator